MKANYLYIITVILCLITPSFTILMKDEDNEREDTIYLKSNINEIYATTEITQYFINKLDNPIELIISFPIKEEISLNKFIIKIGEKTVSSKIMEKKEAEQKYKDSLNEGNNPFLGSLGNEEKSFSINIGNINPKEKVTLKAFFIQNIGTQDMSYEFIIMEKYPTFHYKELFIDDPRNKIIKANFIIETQSKITRLIAPFFDEMAEKKSTYEVIFGKDYKKAEIFYIKNPDDQQNKDVIDPRYGKEFGYPGKVNEPTYLTSFSILFRTQNMNKPTLYYQFNPELKEISYSINYVYSSEKLKNIPIPEIPDQDNKISYYSKYENNLINETPSLFIFLVDQSGSMDGEPIKLVKQSLLIFVQSLPPGSYFQLIGFGSTFKKYNEKPIEYNTKNVEEIKNIIYKLDADFGGTNINAPLKSIYDDNSYSEINLNRHIFLLTDGQVNDRDGCIKLITENNNKFRLHSFGIGNDFDKYFIERSGKLGKGSFFFIDDVEGISPIIIKALNICLRPYLIDIHFNFQNYKKQIQSNITSCDTDEFVNQDEIINFSFILGEKNQINIDKLIEPILIEISAKNPINVIKEKLYFNKEENIIKLKDGDELSKMIIGKALKRNKELIEDKNKEMQFSIKYQILSKNTALFAEIINASKENNQKKLISVNLDDYLQERIYFGCGYSSLGGQNSRFRSYSLIGITDKIGGVDSNIVDSGTIFNLPNSEIIGGTYSEIDLGENESINILKRKDNMKLILSQNIIEGYWDENQETIELNNILDKDEIDKINIKIKSLNKKEEDEKRIKYTILVIYYLNNNFSEKMDEYKLIIHKGKKYLLNQGIQYDEFIKEIKN